MRYENRSLLARKQPTISRKSHWVWSCGRRNQPKSALRPGASCSTDFGTESHRVKGVARSSERGLIRWAFSAFAISANWYMMRDVTSALQWDCAVEGDRPPANAILREMQLG